MINNHNNTNTTATPSQHITTTQTIAKRLLKQSESKAIAKRLQSDCKAIAKRLQSDCKAITKRLQSECKAIAMRLQSDCKAITKRKQSECKAVAKQLQSEREAIAKRKTITITPHNTTHHPPHRTHSQHTPPHSAAEPESQTPLDLSASHSFARNSATSQ
jgi:hypothetical protein